MTNPLLSDWTGPFGLPPFDAITDEDFAPAFEAGLAEGRAAIAAIAANPEPASFANTIEALEQADAILDKVGGVFFNLAGSDSNPAREALQRDLAPKLSAYSSEITSNPALWARISNLWDRRETLGLNDEQARVLMLYHRMFVRAGAALDKAGSERMAAVKSRLASLGTEFTQNLLADERDWFIVLDDLSGLPDFVVGSAMAAATERRAGRACHHPQPLADHTLPAIFHPPRPSPEGLRGLGQARRERRRHRQPRHRRRDAGPAPRAGHPAGLRQFRRLQA